MKFKSNFFKMMCNSVAIYCNTKKEIEALIVELEKLGLKWFDGESLKGTKVSADECCVEVRDFEKVIVNTRDWYERRGYLIKKFPDLIEADNQNDVISHPAHYCRGRYEPKDVIRDWDLNFNLGSAVKYIARAGYKDDIIQDLKKARQFLDFEIEALEEHCEL